MNRSDPVLRNKLIQRFDSMLEEIKKMNKPEARRVETEMETKKQKFVKALEENDSAKAVQIMRELKQKMIVLKK
jgi:hypothetical protein